MTNTKSSKIRKCKGCGLPLSSNQKDLAYTPNLDFDYCQRCFRLKHYGTNSLSKESIIATTNILDTLNVGDRDWIFCINDILNVDFDVIKKYKNKEKIVFIFNKADLVINDRNFSHIIENIIIALENIGVKKPRVMLSSTINKVGIRKLCEFLDELDWSEKIYFIGQSNSGKSSLINALITYARSATKPLTVSKYLNTTIGLKQIKLLRHSIIDTPGYNSESNILSNIKADGDIAKLISKNKLKPVVYQIHESQAFVVDQLIYFTCECKEKGSLNFYFPNSLFIKRIKVNNLKRNIDNNENKKIKVKTTKRITHKFTLDEKIKYNLYISGLGVILIKGVSTIELTTFPNVRVNLLDKVII